MSQNDFIKHWMEGKVSPEDLKGRIARGDAFVQDLEEVITQSSELKVPDKITKEEAWQKLGNALAGTYGGEAKVVKMWRLMPVSIAASVIVTAIAYFTLNKSTVSTSMAETKAYVLPDGSEVTLNADSKITFKRIGWSDKRAVKLEGEAFFQVKKGSTFTVESSAGTVTVLGTSFNVKLRPSIFEVSCFTGKVQVSRDGKAVTLTKGEFTKLDANRLTDAGPFSDGKAMWRTGEFYFERQPLHVVFDELERQFDIEVIYQGDRARLYSGYFNTRNLGEALDMIVKPLSLKYHRENNKKIVVQ